MRAERRNLQRRKCNYYLKVLDDTTHKVVGYFADLSPQGFRVESPQMIAVGQDYRLHVDLAGDFSESASIAFVARSCWLREDIVDPSLTDAGFQIINISTHDNEIFQRVVEKYGSDSV